jgi:uncharacterized protein YgbK (DUF1537 family)
MPAEHLTALGVEVAQANGPAAVAEWFRSGRTGVLVADAVTDAHVRAVAGVVAAHPDVLLAGTAAAIAALAGAIVPSPAPLPPRAAGAWPVRPALVVCGSTHPMARQQVAALVRAGARVVTVGASMDPTLSSADCVVVVSVAADGPAVDPSAVCRSLADAAAAALALGPRCTLVLVGGDTAEAFLGERALLVEGTLDTGVARCRFVDDPTMTVLTKPGGFGRPDTLVRLLGLDGR